MKFDYCEYKDGPQSYETVGKRRILCKGGGGGGDDGGAAQREAERQARIAAGTAKINEIFGVPGQKILQKTGETKLSKLQRATGEYFTDPAAAAMASLLGGTAAPATPVYEDIDLATYEAMKRDGFDTSSLIPVYEDVYAEVDSPASANYAARQKIYDTAKEDTRKFFSTQLGEDQEEAARKSKFLKARQGFTGSSQSNDLDKEFQRRYDRGLLDVANRADSTANNLRTNDEQTRLNLISKVVAGMDQGSAAQNAMSSLQTNLSQANSEYQSQRMANVFADLFNNYNQGQFVAGQQAAKQAQGNPTGNYFANNGGYGGETSRSQ